MLGNPCFPILPHIDASELAIKRSIGLDNMSVLSIPNLENFEYFSWKTTRAKGILPSGE